MNDDLDRLLERANELENDEELESPSENINEEVVSKSDDDTSYFGGEFHERDKLSVNNIVDEVKTSFLDYSMSVIKARALPDLRDGLKPVHRRILWSMYECGYTPDKPHKKCATTVGYVIGHYHPHGDTSVYDAMVRLAQDFNQRYTLVDGHGNFGNIEGDSAAAYRYTESRLAKISLELLRDINKNTVDMEDNFDVTKKEPKVLPSRFPNILVNGSMGIAVGMATNIPPHNLYGTSSIIICCFPFCSSIVALLLIVILPLPVSYAFLIPLLPRIIAPVGKSGPLIYFIKPSKSISGLSIYATQPSITSPKL